MKTHWNSGMDYSFSVIRTMMWISGTWPLQQNDLVCTFRWMFIVIIEFLLVTMMLINFFKNCGDVQDNLEFFLVIETCIHSWMNQILARIYMKKIAVNVSSAIDDWSSFTEQQSYLVMMRYARLGRIITISQLMIGVLSGCIYFTPVMLGNKQQVVTIGNDTVTLWIFVIPLSCLFKGISYLTYKILFVVQILLGFIIFTAECATDNFFFAITMHLCGQLELLKIRFVEIGRKIAEENHYRNLLGPWIRRHYKLIILARNIEDNFNINLLIRLSVTTIVVAVAGMHATISIKQQKYTDLMRNILFVLFFIVQSFLFTHAGDTLRNQSESIVSTICDSTWYKFSPATMKDLILIMMRARIPLHLSAGKFFYITRSTMTDIFKTALTYISFLQRMTE